MSDSNTRDFEEAANPNIDGGGLFAIAYALLMVAESTNRVADQIKRLGNGDASTSIGAIEAYGKHMGEKLDDLVTAINR
jgi:hypothetical protein